MAYLMVDAIDKAITNKRHSPWSNSVGFGVENTSVNVDVPDSIMTRALAKNDQVYFMSCPCHMAHNAALSVPITIGTDSETAKFRPKSPKTFGWGYGPDPTGELMTLPQTL